MRRILLLSAILLLICSVASAQKPYQKWSAFKNDTLAYLKANFQDNKARYIGKKLEVLLNDYELPFINTPPIETSPSVDPLFDGNTYVQGMRLSYLYPLQVVLYKRANRPFHAVSIYFPPPYKDDAHVMLNKIGDAHGDKAKIIALMGHYIVEKIDVSTIYFGD